MPQDNNIFERNRIFDNIYEINIDGVGVVNVEGNSFNIIQDNKFVIDKKKIDIPDEEIPIYNDTDDTCRVKQGNVDYFNYVNKELDTIYNLYFDLAKKIYPLVTESIVKRIFKSNKEVRNINRYLLHLLWKTYRLGNDTIITEKKYIIKNIVNEINWFGLHKNIDIELLSKNYDDIVNLCNEYFDKISKRGFVVKRSNELVLIEINGVQYQKIW